MPEFRYFTGNWRRELKLSFGQPVQRLFPRLEGHDFALGEGVEVFHESMRDVSGADPGRFLHERAIEGEHLFDPHGDSMVDFRALKVGENHDATRGHVSLR